jgi:hypothetical protein
MIQRTKEVQVRRITTKKAILNRRLVDLNRSGRRQHEALEKAGKARRSLKILFIDERAITSVPPMNCGNGTVCALSFLSANPAAP